MGWSMEEYEQARKEDDPWSRECVVCIAAGTLVSLADGTSIPIERVQKGAHVLSYYAALEPEETEGLTVRQVHTVLDQGVKECVELLFSDKRTLVCTPDHRIRTADGRWVEAKALLVGADEVAVGGVEYPNATAVAEGDEAPFAYPSTDQVTNGAHRDTKVLPLSRVQLVGRRGVGVHHVYDLSVPSLQGDVSRSFVANGVVVHNCLDAPATHIILDCFHLCLCEGCAERMNEASRREGKEEVCPKCRSPVRLIHKTY